MSDLVSEVVDLSSESALKEYSWSNSDNNAFYEAVKAEGLQKLAEKGGLATGCDMRILTPYWSKAKSILEVGAGYGRVIEYLLKHQFQGKITAIERCATLFSFLENQYKSNDNVRLLHKDIRYLEGFKEKFDLILFLWTGIGDFSLKEQLLIIKKLANFLQKGGILIIDTLPENTIPLESRKCGFHVYLFEVNNTAVYINVSTILEIKEYARKAGFSTIEHKLYRTESGRKRAIYLLG
jgi:SAM-dependent methyltransferase